MDYQVQRETAGEKFQLLPSPITMPGHCAGCGFTGTNVGDPGDIRVFIDLGLDIDFFGRVYLCTSCVREMANVLGWLTLEQAEQLREQVAAQESELIVLREQNERLRASLASLLGQPDVTDAIIRDSSVEVERPRDESLEGTTETNESAKSASDKPVSEQGPDSVPATNGSNSLGEFQL